MTQEINQIKSVSMAVQHSHHICTAHRLMNHEGHCNRLHGHNYKITYHLSGPFNNTTGMIIDFGDIKRIIFTATEQALDHKTLLHKDDPLVGVLRKVMGDDAVVTIDVHPTAENMAGLIISSVQNNLPPHVTVWRVEVEETPGAIAYAEVTSTATIEKVKGEDNVAQETQQ